MKKEVLIKNIKAGAGNPLVFIGGPCVIENEKMLFSTAAEIKKITEELDIPFILKSSYKKANRTSVNSFTGIGDRAALDILRSAAEKYDVPCLTDIHTIEEAQMAAEYTDVLQIPAFLSRQTELLVAAGETGKVINIKKGQFMAPEDIGHAVKKVESTGNERIMVTERGVSFGYHNLVVDMKGLVVMGKFGYPVVMDATHAVQIPSKGDKSEGQPEFIPALARAAVATGIDVLFMEVHPDPANAMSDAASQYPLHKLRNFLSGIKELDALVKKLNLTEV